MKPLLNFHVADLKLDGKMSTKEILSIEVTNRNIIYNNREAIASLLSKAHMHET